MPVTMCQACLTSRVTCKIPVDEIMVERPYRLCEACAHRLEERALRPLEWYRLAALHGPMTYLLHDDFYDEDGRADQNKIPVDQASLFPIPKLSAVSGDIDALLDFAITRWDLKDDVVAALQNHSPGELFTAMSALEHSRPSPWIECRCYEIAAHTLGPRAYDWIEPRWDRGTRRATIYAFLKAAASCLPNPETVPRAIAAVEALDERDHLDVALALTEFRSPLVLQWIERRVRSPVSDGWGSVAALSRFDWATAERWLAAGRPLSLVALDALAYALCPPSPYRLPRFVVRLADAPPSQIIHERLRAYARKDDVPRVTKLVNRIIEATAY